jgi:tetratricopeptide (TPR) repeat protein
LRSIAERRRPYLRIAQLYALGLRPDRARATLAQFAADVKDTTFIRASEPERHKAMAAVALAEHRPLDAVVEYRQADTLGDGPADECAQCLPMNLGRAFDLADMPDSAVAEYEHYLATPRLIAGPFEFTDFKVLAGIHKRLGELYEAKGDKQNAAGHYLRFVELWKNADPELQPKVAEARARLARLQDTERR